MWSHSLAGRNGRTGSEPVIVHGSHALETLAPGGGSSQTAAPSSSGFNWADAGIGAGAIAGALLVLAGGLLAVRRRDAIPV